MNPTLSRWIVPLEKCPCSRQENRIVETLQVELELEAVVSSAVQTHSHYNPHGVTGTHKLRCGVPRASDSIR